MMENGHWHAHGKLLLSGEYLVMEGAKSFALPLKQGQSLSVRSNSKNVNLQWQAFYQDIKWFTAEFERESFNIIQTDHPQLAENLKRILEAVRRLSEDFITNEDGCIVRTKLDFHPEYGFGSSSTLISNLAWWAGVNPYELLRLTFGGSGYDIACARVDFPIFYQLTEENPSIQEVDFKPAFSKQLYFVYLGKKQKSTESIKSFKKEAVFGKGELKAISLISEQIAVAKSLQEFEDLLESHERIMSAILQRPTITSLLFADYKGTVKSLGGWGGDFVLVTTNQTAASFKADMQKRGFPVVFAFDELVL